MCAFTSFCRAPDDIVFQVMGLSIQLIYEGKNYQDIHAWINQSKTFLKIVQN